MLALSDHRSINNKQRGATLIVVLVMLIAMTFLGLASMSDNNLQLAMVRNAQMQTGAYTAALTEINAQLDAINNNPPLAPDALITNVVNNGVVDGANRSVQPAQLLAAVIGDEDAGAYVTGLTVTQLNFQNSSLTSGYGVDGDVTIAPFQMQSFAQVRNTNASSTQTQGFNYMVANSNK